MCDKHRIFMSEREGMEENEFDRATWSLLSFVTERNYDIVISMNKARNIGWQRWADSWDELELCLHELESSRVLPARNCPL